MYYLKKIFKMVFSIYLIGTISFLLLELIPGDPALAILGLESSPEDIAILRENLGLNKSLGERYFQWGKGVILGDFGNSFRMITIDFRNSYIDNYYSFRRINSSIFYYT